MYRRNIEMQLTQRERHPRKTISSSRRWQFAIFFFFFRRTTMTFPALVPRKILCKLCAACNPLNWPISWPRRRHGPLPDVPYIPQVPVSTYITHWDISPGHMFCGGSSAICFARRCHSLLDTFWRLLPLSRYMAYL